MNDFIKRLENLFMAVSFAEAHYMNLFTRSVNDTLLEDVFLDNRFRKESTDKSRKFFKIHRRMEMQ